DPSLFDRAFQYPIWQSPAQRTADRHVLAATDQSRGIIRTKMPFRFRGRRKRHRAFFAQSCVSRHLPRFVFPALDQGGVAYDFDLPLVIGKTYATAETLLVKAAQLRLIIVMVSRAEERSAQSASRDIREISLNWIRLHNVDLVKVAISESECISLEEFSVGRHSAVLAKLIKRRFLLCREANSVAHRFFQEQTGQRKQRISN